MKSATITVNLYHHFSKHFHIQDLHHNHLHIHIHVLFLTKMLNLLPLTLTSSHLTSFD